MVDAWISSGVVLHSTSDGAMPSDVIRCAVLMVGAGEFDDVLGVEGSDGPELAVALAARVMRPSLLERDGAGASASPSLMAREEVAEGVPVRARSSRGYGPVAGIVEVRAILSWLASISSSSVVEPFKLPSPLSQPPPLLMEVSLLELLLWWSWSWWQTSSVDGTGGGGSSEGGDRGGFGGLRRGAARLAPEATAGVAVPVAARSFPAE